MKLTLHVWRQSSTTDSGRFEQYQLDNVSPDSSFLEMLDELNEKLLHDGKDPVAFEHDCREGICGSCGMVINGSAHGPQRTTTCQLHMRTFKDGDEIWIEPWRAEAFPVLKDLVVDRSSFDRIIQAGGFISVNTGNPQDANATPVPRRVAELAFDAAECIGCGACVAACPNASAMLFTAAKIGHLNLLPQGQPERRERTKKMLKQQDVEGFGHCTNHEECEAVCPKGISVRYIAMANADMRQSYLGGRSAVVND